MESLIEDSNYISRTSHLEHFNLPWNNRRKSSLASGKKKPSSALDYFQKELTPSQIRALYKLYQLDFEMFGYSASEYLDSLPWNLFNKGGKRNLDCDTCCDIKFNLYILYYYFIVLVTFTNIGTGFIGLGAAHNIRVNERCCVSLDLYSNVELG